MAAHASLLQLPERPHEAGAEADDDEEQQQGLIGGGNVCHAADKAPAMSGVPAAIQIGRLGA